MTKKELIDLLADVPDDMQITIMSVDRSDYFARFSYQPLEVFDVDIRPNVIELGSF